ncbi:MAG: CDP-alcohol phosphatidyltransferase family protein [Rhodoferax sp.]|uniref:CDP-alcohol phosphatidyltransferase family protein n=1 Tax=Rhodoferax sp. TaxID=50421 RepID=UPI002723380C|nr:CDP-alcohol phosphatidyltransferase family protein [Rhodoferax sp.]MDO8449257.1 CDP-alcohol phosphatidyltransferase family protein [Rhodoferax sp.]
MLDRTATALIKPLVTRLARALLRAGLSANQVTIAGFLIGLLAALLIANGAYMTGAVAIFASRLCDALDGALARLTRATDRGGFLDIALDFLFYASIPLAFAFSDPARNALPAAVLLAAFIGTSSSFLAFAVIAAKRGMVSVAYPDKSFFFLGGLTEATETLAFFAVMCLWPAHFIELAYVFAALCGVTVITRIWWGWRAFS